MLCSEENSYFCLVVIRINVKVLGSLWVPYPQMSIFGDLDCILNGKISKACWPVVTEKDLTHIIWYPSNQIQ